MSAVARRVQIAMKGRVTNEKKVPKRVMAIASVHSRRRGPCGTSNPFVSLSSADLLAHPYLPTPSQLVVKCAVIRMPANLNHPEAGLRSDNRDSILRLNRA